MDMEAYTGFAQLYDRFMDQVPYEDWCRWIVQQLSDRGIRDGLLLDLGCGTGTMTMLLDRAGYDMIGVDNSVQMLGEARRKQEDADILYLCQDIEALELYGTVRGVVSVCDSLNYVTEPEGLRRVFALVHNYLDPQGLFLFDMNTRYKYEMLGDTVIAENRPDCSFIWENTYDAKARLNEYAVTFYNRRKDGAYDRFEEYHYQKAYDPEEIRAWLAEAGFTLLGVWDGYSSRPLEKDSQRMVFAARADKPFLAEPEE